MVGAARQLPRCGGWVLWVACVWVGGRGLRGCNLPLLLLPRRPLFPQELTVDRDRSSLFYVARALHGLQQQWGAIPHVKGKGDAAAAVQRILARMRAEQGRDAPAAGELLM